MTRSELSDMLPEGFRFSSSERDDGVGGGRYEIIRKVTAGGQGTVFQAQDLILGIPAAAKFAVPKDEATRRRFVDEARKVASLSGHPNVVVIRDLGSCQSKLGQELVYIVFEWLGDGDLRSMVKADPKDLELNTVLRAARDACHGLAYLHAQHLAHRDLKPANLLRAPGNCVKIADLGLAKNIDLRTDPETMAGWGTPGYFAPEQLSYGWASRPERDHIMADIFQMGVTLYELFEGHRPFEVTDDAFQLRSMAREGPKPILRFKIPQVLEETIREMLSPDPGSRISSIAEVSRRLDAILSEREFAGHFSATRIRSAIKDKIVQVFELFRGRNSPLIPLGVEEPDWYATILLRPTQRAPASSASPVTRMANVFYPIYLPHLRGREEDTGKGRIRHHHDWIMDEESDYKPLPIDQCCSGLVIRWYDEDYDWRRAELYDREFFEVFSDDKNRIRYAVCRNLRAALAPNHPRTARLVHDHYATDYRRDGDHQRKKGRDLKWDMRATDSRDPEQVHVFRRDMQTEILVPLYEQRPQDDVLGPDNIVGVANFEWVERLSPARERVIGEQLAAWIHDQHMFPVSSFLAEIVAIVLPSYERLTNTEGQRPSSGRGS